MDKCAVLLNDTRVDNHHGCDRVISTIYARCRDVGIEIVAAAPAHADWRHNAPFLRAFEAAELVIINGEGTIHHNRPAGRLLLEAGAWARRANVPAALINCTWQDNGPDFQEAVKNFSLVSVREGLSEAELTGCGVDLMRVPDLSLDGITWQQGRRGGIGVTDSVVRAEIPWLYSLMQRLHDGQPCSITYPLVGLAGQWQFFRRYLGRGDLVRIKELYRILASRSRQWQVAGRDGAEFLRQIAAYRLLISGRFHATCMAMGVGTPFLALSSNSHKMEGMLADAGLSARLVTRGELTERRIEAAASWSPQEREALRDYLADAAIGRQQLFRRIRELL